MRTLRNDQDPITWEPARLPFRATDTMPGSSERVTVYAERVLRGEMLYHPDDFVPTVESPVAALATDVLGLHHRRRES
jgi:hypothetical protein